MEITKNDMVSIIIPVKDEEDNIRHLYDQLTPVLSGLGHNYEILFVEDGAVDGTTSEKIKEISNENVRLIHSKSFGKSAALACGFSNAKGEIIITMDGDLQDDPKEIPRFLKELENYDMVSGWKYKRQDPITKTIPSKIFNWLLRKTLGLNIHDSNCGFKAYRSHIIKDINLYGELHRYIPALIHWKGYRIGEIKIDHHPRIYGKSKFGITRLIKGFFDLITVRFLISYADRPLHLFGGVGIISLFLGTIICLFLINEWIKGYGIGDRPLLLLGILLIVTGVQLLSLGLIGELIRNKKTAL